MRICHLETGCMLNKVSKGNMASFLIMLVVLLLSICVHLIKKLMSVVFSPALSIYIIFVGVLFCAMLCMIVVAIRKK
jgi:hypothetical protein